MNKNELYRIYQNNLKLLEQQMSLTKKTTQILLGKKCYLENMQQDIKRIDYEILSSTRLFTFLICSWFEARFYKMLYEGSCEGFTEQEISIILGQKNKPLYKKWTDAYNLAICKKYKFSFETNRNYSQDFSIMTDSINYTTIINLLNTIEDAIQVRNKLAHGQWFIQLNSNRDNFSPKIDEYLNEYDNIQKLHYQHQTYKYISEIIHDIIVSKATYERDFNLKMKQINTNQVNIAKKDFLNYCKPFLKNEIKKRRLQKFYYNNEL